MSMSTNVVGFKPADDRWMKMKAVWDASVAAGILVPEVVQKFFNWKAPDPNGVEVELPTTDWSDHDSRSGLELQVSDIPPDVKIIRFYNSW